MTTPKTFEEWEAEYDGFGSSNRITARHAWEACESAHAKEREAAERLAQTIHEYHLKNHMVSETVWLALMEFESARSQADSTEGKAQQDRKS